jgi:nitrile hydratase
MSDPANPVGDYRRLQAAIEELLILKGVVARDEIDAQVAAMDARDHRRGAKLVARAWVDAAYKARLLANGRAAAEELGIAVGPLHLIVVENTPATHNVIVCTLCSCYPRALLGMPPEWYKSTAYRARTVREPRKVLAEFGTSIPEGVTIRVHDSTADMRYMVLPMRPPGSDALTEVELAELVNRDCLVGTRLPEAPRRRKGAAR